MASNKRIAKRDPPDMLHARHFLVGIPALRGITTGNPVVFGNPVAKKIPSLHVVVSLVSQVVSTPCFGTHIDEPVRTMIW